MLKYLNPWWWLRKLLYVWVRSKGVPRDLKKGLGLVPGAPICFVLKFRSITDRLILSHHCAKGGLGEPVGRLEAFGSRGKNPRILYLGRPGILQKKRDRRLPAALFQLVKEAEKGAVDITLVPVSIFWGRNPGREERSLVKLLFFDDEHGGLFQRFLTFFFHGRGVFCRFGQPVSVMQLIREGAPTVETAKKLRRVLRVHFSRQRDLVLGPQIYDRRQVMERILQARGLQQAILQEAEKKQISPEKAEERARKYAEEVCARLSWPAIRFF